MVVDLLEPTGPLTNLRRWLERMNAPSDGTQLKLKLVLFIYEDQTVFVYPIQHSYG